MTSAMLGRMISELVRRDGAMVLARLLRSTRDLEVAEMALRDAALSAISAWSEHGVPAEPVEWLRAAAQKRVELLGNVLQPRRVHEPVDPVVADPRVTGGDDRLYLAFLCAHPALTRDDQVMLALRTLCGLSTREIASMFGVTDADVNEARTRASKALVATPAQLPTPENFPARLQLLLDIVWRVFEMTPHATDHGPSIAHDVAAEAIRLARMLAQTLPTESSAQALLAALLMVDAQRITRLSTVGEVVPAAEQNHALWDRTAIVEGLAILGRLDEPLEPTSYHLIALVAAVHVRATNVEDTNWARLLELTTELQKLRPSVRAELEIAIATGMVLGLDRGLRLVDRLIARKDGEGSPMLFSTRAWMCKRAGRLVEARTGYLSALTLARTVGEREYFQQCLVALTP